MKKLLFKQLPVFILQKLSNTERKNDGFLHIYNTPNIVY